LDILFTFFIKNQELECCVVDEHHKKHVSHLRLSDLSVANSSAIDNQCNTWRIRVKKCLYHPLQTQHACNWPSQSCRWKNKHHVL